jgi:dTDP-4-dehydrorhamnose reductase
MRILVTGKEGQVGWELQRTLAVLGEVIVADRSVIDLANPEQAAAAVRQIKPQVIVNAAAYTAVDKAESEEALARSVNALTPGAMAAEAKKLGALFVHYSTDYVFDGQAIQPYLETDGVAPASAYGRTKEEGEQLIRESGANHLILRTAWVYGVRGKNFLLTMLRLAKERDRLRVVGDQVGCPTWSRMIAEATAVLVARNSEVGVAETVNLTSQGQTSWHGFASAIVAEGAKLGLCKDIPVDAISTADYPTPAKRPPYSVLSTKKLSERFGIELPQWDEALKMCLGDLDRR